MKKIKSKNILNDYIIGYEFSDDGTRGMIVTLSAKEKRYRGVSFNSYSCDVTNNFWGEQNYKSIRRLCKGMGRSIEYTNTSVVFYKFDSYKELLNWIADGL